MMRRLLAWILTGALLLPLALLVMLSLARHWTWPAVLPAEWQIRLWRDMFTDARRIQNAPWRSLGMAAGRHPPPPPVGFPPPPGPPPLPPPRPPPPPLPPP